jgi:3-hydroxybutyryl-CoA dehydrogenase
MNSWNAIGVVGAGTMGRGIAQVAAQSGANVWLCDTSVDALEASQASLAKVMDRLVEKGRMSPDEARGVRDRIRTTTSLEALKDCDMVVEAIVEDLDVKSTLFKKLEGIVAKSCVLATNTSSLSVTALARACQHPDRVLGLHFFNPAPLMALVEVVPALQTDPELPAFAAEQMRAWNKAPALAQDTPGFIVNRVARPFYSEALRMLEEGIASAQDIDASMRAEGFRMGPFELMDLIGHDVNYAVTSTVHAAFFGDSRYRPSHTQRQLVAASWLGRKSGRGFYVYAEDGTRTGTDGTPSKEVSRRILAMLMNEAADAVFWRVASATDVDTAMQKGVNYPKGLLAWAEECGLPSIVETLDGLRARYGEERYRCSPLLRDLARAGGSFFAP